MIYIDNWKFTNIEITDYKPKFVTDYDEGFSNGTGIYDTYEEAKKHKAYGPIYIAFPIEVKKDN